MADGTGVMGGAGMPMRWGVVGRKWDVEYN